MSVSGVGRSSRESVAMGGDCGGVGSGRDTAVVDSGITKGGHDEEDC